MKEVVIKSILESKKYRSLSADVVKRVVDSLEGRYKKCGDLERRSKEILHQIWGAYYSTRPDFNKLYEKLVEDRSEQSLLNILKIHSSTSERIDSYAEIFDEVFKRVGRIDSILDIGCGFDPLFFLIYKMHDFRNYTSIDIDIDEIEFLNRVFELYGEKRMSAVVGDVFKLENNSADLIFMFKLLPVIEQQSRGSSKKILDSLDFKYCVVTFPTRSIGGKKSHTQNLLRVC